MLSERQPLIKYLTSTDPRQDTRDTKPWYSLKSDIWYIHKCTLGRGDEDERKCHKEMVVVVSTTLFHTEIRDALSLKLSCPVFAII